jgi:hypothetical protein
VNASIRIRGRRVAVAGGLAALVWLALMAAPGRAARGDSVQITRAPAIAGQAVSGELLTAQGATWRGTGTPVASYRWVRCADDASWQDCSLIDGASGTQYRLTDADVGQHVLVWLHVSSGRASDDDVSSPTTNVAAKPAPAPAPTPAPAPSPSPQPTPAPISTDLVPPDTTTPAAPTAGVLGQQALRWLSPFPIVRIRGWLTPTGARVSMLTVRAPRGSRISVRCSGRSCPRKRFARTSAVVHVTPYERVLRGSMRLEISVTRAGFVGKRTVITLRRGKAPARRDLCLYPGVRKAKSCTAQ